MQHNPYFILNRKIDERYSRLRADYPLSFYYLETELRLTLTGQHVAQERNIKNIINKYSIFRIIIFKIYFLVHFFKLSRERKKRKSIYIALNRHRDLTKKLTEYIYNENYIILDTTKDYGKLLSFDNVFPVARLALNSLSLRKLHKIISERGLIKILKNKDFMQEMERVLEEQVQHVEIYMRLNAISGLILQNEHTFEEKIIVKAANQLNIPIITVAHGYIHETDLITIAPFTANYILLWTQSQKDLLDSYDTEFANRTLFLGWPFQPLNKKIEMKSTVLIILTDVDNSLSEEQYLLSVAFLDQYIHSVENCRIRLHPASMRMGSARVSYLIDRYRRYLDINPLEDSLGSARLVIGHDSSVLVTSVMNNIPTFRFKETAQAPMPEVMTLKMEKILKTSIEDLVVKAEDKVIIRSDLTNIAYSIFNRLIA